MIKLSAFADEVSSVFCEQIEYLVGEKISFLEIRFVNGKNVLDLTEIECKEAKQILSDNNIAVSAIASPIGKIRINEPWEQHLLRFQRAVDIAHFFETKLIRVFSYYPAEGTNIEDYRDEVTRRMVAKVDLIKNDDLILVHENEANIFGQGAQNCVEIIKSVNSPKLRLAYDPGNFVWNMNIIDNMKSCWPIMRPYVKHVHIKDWKVGQKTGSLPGYGDGQIPELISELLRDNYNGFLTLEPHLNVGGQFGGNTKADQFSDAVRSVRKIMADNGISE